MTWRRLILGLSFVVVIGFLTLRLTRSPEYQFTKANYEKIQQGMTEKDVQAILGEPSGNYASGPFEKSNKGSFEVKYGNAFQSSTIKHWVSDNEAIIVTLDDQETVARKVFLPNGQKESVLMKIRRWLGF